MNAARTTTEPEQEVRRLSPDRLEDAFARWQPELLGTLYYLTGNHEDARDALQETFIKCWRHRDTMDEVENLKAWIFRIALNAGRDVRGTAWRRRRTGLADEGVAIPSKECAPDDHLEREEQLIRLRSAIRVLRSEEQEVFLLRQNGELTYDEIAAAIGIPLGTVKTRMRMALSKLREALGEGVKE
jgi:RNA polymerase sigma factor (sigma-70 family)